MKGNPWQSDPTADRIPTKFYRPRNASKPLKSQDGVAKSKPNGTNNGTKTKKVKHAFTKIYYFG